MCLTVLTGRLELVQAWARESQGMLYQSHLDRVAEAWADVGREPGAWLQGYDGVGRNNQLELVWARAQCMQRLLSQAG